MVNTSLSIFIVCLSFHIAPFSSSYIHYFFHYLLLISSLSFIDWSFLLFIIAPITFILITIFLRLLSLRRLSFHHLFLLFSERPAFFIRIFAIAFFHLFCFHIISFSLMFSPSFTADIFRQSFSALRCRRRDAFRCAITPLHYADAADGRRHFIMNISKVPFIFIAPLSQNTLSFFCFHYISFHCWILIYIFSLIAFFISLRHWCRRHCFRCHFVTAFAISSMFADIAIDFHFITFIAFIASIFIDSDVIFIINTSFERIYISYVCHISILHHFSFSFSFQIDWALHWIFSLLLIFISLPSFHFHFVTPLTFATLGENIITRHFLTSHFNIRFAAISREPCRAWWASS